MSNINILVCASVSLSIFGHHSCQPWLKSNSLRAQVLAADFPCNCQTSFYVFFFPHYSWVDFLCIYASLNVSHSVVKWSHKLQLKVKGKFTPVWKSLWIIITRYQSDGYFHSYQKNLSIPTVNFFLVSFITKAKCDSVEGVLGVYFPLKETSNFFDEIGFEQVYVNNAISPVKLQLECLVLQVNNGIKKYKECCGTFRSLI